MTEFLIKSNAVMGVLLGLYYILFEREKMHRFKKLYLIGSFILLAQTPSLYAKEKACNTTQSLTSKDTTEARRDEYFKEVQIIIDDKPAHIFIDKPYEKLSKQEKEYYLSNIPEKEKARGLQLADYDSFISDEAGIFFIDNKKTTREEILKHKREYFACGGSKRFQKEKHYFFFTYPYFDKNIKHIKDHYPEKTYKITILNEARDYLLPENSPLLKKQNYERNGHSNDSDATVEVSSWRYGYTDEMKNDVSTIYAQFPGGKKKFSDYLFSNIKMSYLPEELVIDFTINTNGALSDIRMDESTDPLLAEEIKRVMLASPKWIPMQEKNIPQPVGTRDRFKKTQNN
jgi:hypothetical protein